MKQFRRFALIATAVTYFLIFVGGLVRVSGAGLGCPDWPKCFGQWFPPTGVSQLPEDIDPAQFNFALAWIEYVNRLIGVAVGILIAATAIWALARFRGHKRIVIPAVLAAILVAYQGWQGGRLIASELESFLVSAHMVIAFIIGALMIYVTRQAYLVGAETHTRISEPVKGLRLMLMGLAAIAVIQVLGGTQVRTAIEHVATAYPLLQPSEWIGTVGFSKYFHAILGVVVALMTWIVVGKIEKPTKGKQSAARQGAWALGVLAILQLAIGGAVLFGGAQPLIQLLHLTAAALYTGMLVLVYTSARQEGALK